VPVGRRYHSPEDARLTRAVSSAGFRLLFTTLPSPAVGRTASSISPSRRHPLRGAGNPGGPEPSRAGEVPRPCLPVAPFAIRTPGGPRDGGPRAMRGPSMVGRDGGAAMVWGGRKRMPGRSWRRRTRRFPRSAQSTCAPAVALGHPLPPSHRSARETSDPTRKRTPPPTFTSPQPGATSVSEDERVANSLFTVRFRRQPGLHTLFV
jgi:hypothetical protein